MEEHQKRILTYCEEDVNTRVWLGRQMLPELDIEQALWRGKYCKANAYFEHNGVPVDRERFRAIENESSKLKLSIANKIEETHGYGVYVVEGKETTQKKPTPVFKMAKFRELLDSKGIAVGSRGAMWQAGSPRHRPAVRGSTAVSLESSRNSRPARKSSAGAPTVAPS